MAATIAAILKILMQINGHREKDVVNGTGLNQPTVHRILTGKSMEPKNATLKALGDYYNVNPAQLRGEVPIDFKNLKKAVPPAVIRSTNLFEQLSPEEQKGVLRWLESSTKKRKPK